MSLYHRYFKMFVLKIMIDWQNALKVEQRALWIFLPRFINAPQILNFPFFIVHIKIPESKCILNINMTKLLSHLYSRVEGKALIIN